MEKKFLTEQMGEHEQWYAQASSLREKTDLVSFIDHLMNDYSHDLETVVHAMAAGSLACISVMNLYPEGYISSGQKHKLLGLLVRRFANMQGPIMLVQWLGVLNHTNSSMFNTIPAGVWQQIQEHAASILEQDMRQREADVSRFSQQEKLAHQQSLLAEEQVQHLKSILSGNAPWGLRIGEQ